MSYRSYVNAASFLFQALLDSRRKLVQLMKLPN